MKIAKNLSRNLGQKILLQSTSVNDLILQKNKILSSIHDNGCVVIKNVDFNQKQIVQFSRKFWDEVIELPLFLCFNNQDQHFKQVARVGNVELDGTLKQSQKQAAYWHQDGNFWGERKKHIYNCLHTREEPQEGGDTHILDLVQGTEFLKLNYPNIYNRLKQLYGVLNVQQINDFKNVKDVKGTEAKQSMGISQTTKHNLIAMNGRKGEEVLFLSVHEFRENNGESKCVDFTVEGIHKLLESEMGYYAHKWEKGDMLIWDNLQVMHRSSGHFKGRRLLFRTQGRFNE